MDNILAYVLSIASVANIFYTWYTTYKSTKLQTKQVEVQNDRTDAQNVLDYSMAASNAQKLLVDIQKEQVENKKEIKELRAIIDGAHLEVTLGIPIGSAPKIKCWKWIPKPEDIRIDAPVV
jgi:predicted transcriptional regulator